VAWVDPDNEGIIRLALECLIGHGHSRIAYVAGPGVDSINNDYLADVIPVRPSYDDQERRRHFTTLMEQAGLKEYSQCIFSPADSRWHLSPEAFRTILDSGVTAVVCVNDFLASQMMTLAEAAGVCVPGDLSIVGVDNDSGSPRLELTTIEFGYDTVGHLAINAWMELNQGRPAPECCKVVPVKLIERGTTGRPGYGK
jgi:DNA-binding LacI/PurR family transcriptional regulator